jgi:hypothetical protein
MDYRRGSYSQKNINFMNFDSVLCPKNKCSYFQSGRFTTLDTDPHLTHEFSMGQSHFIYNEIFKDIKLKTSSHIPYRATQPIYSTEIYVEAIQTCEKVTLCPCLNLQHIQN